MKLFLIIFFCIQYTEATAQHAGDVDITFGNPVTAIGDSTRFNGDVKVITAQPDGKILVGGAFTAYNGNTHKGIVRLMPNGDEDVSFIGSGISNGFVNSVAIDSLGRIYVVGVFDSINGMASKNLVRLHSNGTVDVGFNVGAGIGLPGANKVVVQSNGQVIVGGDFSLYNNDYATRILRINTDGTKDTSFVTGSSFNAVVKDMIVQPGNKVLVAGSFSKYRGVTRYGIVRLSNNGELDLTFVATGCMGEVNSIDQGWDGKIIVAGDFDFCNGGIAKNIIRLSSDGATDTTFNAAVQNIPQDINKVAVRSNGGIMVAGRYSSQGWWTTINLYCLTHTGALDTMGFEMEYKGNGYINALCVLPNGDALIGGSFNKYNGRRRNGIAKIKADGKVDDDYMVEYGCAINIPVDIAIDTNDNILLAGMFRYYDDMAGYGFVGVGTNGRIGDIGNNKPNEDCSGRKVFYDSVTNKIYVVGTNLFYNNQNLGAIARFNSDNTADTTFNAALGALYAAALQPDGKIIVTGSYLKDDHVSKYSLARLNIDGSVDTTFQENVLTHLNDGVSDIAVLPNGQILVTGRLATFDSLGGRALLRFNNDGSLDNSFTALTGVAGSVFSKIKVQADNKILFYQYYPYLVIRLNADGSEDQSFFPPNDTIITLALQQDGKILACRNSNGLTGSELVRYNSDGTFDNTFTSLVADGQISVIGIQSDTKIIIGGAFRKVNNWYINRLARVYANDAVPSSILNSSSNTLTLKIVPNPSKGSFVVKWDALLKERMVLSLQSMMGEVVYTSVISNGQSEAAISVETVPGVYIAKLSGITYNASMKVVLK